MASGVHMCGAVVVKVETVGVVGMETAATDATVVVALKRLGSNFSCLCLFHFYASRCGISEKVSAAM